MNNTSLYNGNSTRNFGVLTDISSDINKLFGDETGRSVSLRTAHGFKDVFNLQNLDDDTAEDIVHGFMTLTPVLLTRKNDAANAVGVVLLAGLLGCFLAGSR